MSKVKDIASYLETLAPLSFQEKYDNSGLIVGNPEDEVKGVLISLDTTEQVVEEAVRKGCNVIVSHHPIIFGGLNKLTGSSYVERTVINSIKKGISIYAIHTNLDNVMVGVNAMISQKLELEDLEILIPRSGTLSKLVTFVPGENREQVLKALFEAGAGQIGAYDHCSFTVDGSGSFRPGETADPHIGRSGEDETVNESRIEVIFPTQIWKKIKTALDAAHPYEEVAYYLTDLDNENNEVGSGMIGRLKRPIPPKEFLTYLKEKMHVQLIRHTKLPKDKTIQKVAVCGGSGSFLISAAINRGADVFVTGDVKYHEFFNADDKIIVADIGHYESEVFTKELLHDLLIKKFNTFALHLSETVTNPISYF